MVSPQPPHLIELQYNVAGLLQEPTGSVRTTDVKVPISQLSQIDESVDVMAPFAGTVRLLNASDSILARIEGDTVLRLTCARCLEPFAHALHIDLEEEFRPRIDIFTGAVLPNVGEDASLIINEYHVLDLSEVLRQAMLLTQPLPPLCRDDCAGLCPTCGVNKNLETCDCHTVEIDSRWAALSALSQNDSNNLSGVK